MLNPEAQKNSIEQFFKPDSFFLIAGPCVVESELLLEEVAQHLIPLCKELDIPFVFKASYKKANRSSLHSFTGIGDLKALELLNNIRNKYEVPVITDIHSATEAAIAAAYVDLIQIPAFLCRQTDLLVAAAHTRKPVFVKKGQFMSPGAMRFVIDKIKESGNPRIALIERGSCFGYQDLVVDFRAIPIMQEFQLPVIMDCTHALQKPNQETGISGGLPQYIETMAKAAVAVGVNGLFIETHPDPMIAKSDGANMLKLSEMRGLLNKVLKIRNAIEN